jgi:hypothetical protein
MVFNTYLTLNSATAVVRGALLRAFNKELGPDRITGCSYGFLHTELYEPDSVVAHRKVKCMVDKVDGERYIDSTIKWLINKVSVTVIEELSEKSLFS